MSGKVTRIAKQAAMANRNGQMPQKMVPIGTSWRDAANDKYINADWRANQTHFPHNHNDHSEPDRAQSQL